MFYLVVLLYYISNYHLCYRNDSSKHYTLYTLAYLYTQKDLEDSKNLIRFKLILMYVSCTLYYYSDEFLSIFSDFSYSFCYFYFNSRDFTKNLKFR